ncbi:hypothetical protein B0H66DRAFT_630524 [Apodospora peruviana]|uniref:Uncharacterized protein n=1 Tax=Apodospora peruviana TaxID=516989 RepID=A0AAE0HWB8_9PEZI|nr:hypothetical protein B0H66DRAFT_630524 [Apodospora peruviana]
MHWFHRGLRRRSVPFADIPHKDTDKPGQNIIETTNRILFKLLNCKNIPDDILNLLSEAVTTGKPTVTCFWVPLKRRKAVKEEYQEIRAETEGEGDDRLFKIIDKTSRGLGVLWPDNPSLLTLDLSPVAQDISDQPSPSNSPQPSTDAGTDLADAHTELEVESSPAAYDISDLDRRESKLAEQEEDLADRKRTWQTERGPGRQKDDLARREAKVAKSKARLARREEADLAKQRAELARREADLSRQEVEHSTRHNEIQNEQLKRRSSLAEAGDEMRTRTHSPEAAFEGNTADENEGAIFREPSEANNLKAMAHRVAALRQTTATLCKGLREERC